MMDKLLNRILWQKQTRWELILAGSGFLLGLVLFLFCFQVYLDIDAIFGRRMSLEKQPDYLILSKQLDTGNLLDSSAASFSPEEIAELQGREFTLDLGLVEYNHFAARAGVEVFGQGFLTELFFESVEDRFLDEIPAGWEWQEESKVVPVIISRDFLLLYNFGFSRARGFPLLSEEMLRSVPVQLQITGNGKTRKFAARITGLSDRLASILVPHSFLQWANTHYRDVEPPGPSRLIISVKNRADAAIIKYLQEHRYETSKEKLRLSDAGFTIRIVLSLLAMIGLLLIALAFVIFLTTFRLIIARSQTEIKRLSELGYTSSSLAGNLVVVLAVVLSGIAAAGAGLLLLAVTTFRGFLAENGFQLTNAIHPVIPLAGVGLVSLALGFNWLAVVRALAGFYRKKK